MALHRVTIFEATADVLGTIKKIRFDFEKQELCIEVVNLEEALVMLQRLELPVASRSSGVALPVSEKDLTDVLSGQVPYRVETPSELPVVAQTVSHRQAEPVKALPVQVEPVQAEPVTASVAAVNPVVMPVAPRVVSSAAAPLASSIPKPEAVLLSEGGSSTTVVKRKVGRPTKAEQQARADAWLRENASKIAAARGNGNGAGNAASDFAADIGSVATEAIPGCTLRADEPSVAYIQVVAPEEAPTAAPVAAPAAVPATAPAVVPATAPVEAQVEAPVAAPIAAPEAAPVAVETPEPETASAVVQVVAEPDETINPISVEGDSQLPPEVLNAISLREVLAWLFDQGVVEYEEVLARCFAMQKQVGVLDRITNLEERVKRGVSLFND
jgi:hypothetical protein